MSLTQQPRTCPACAAANRPERELCARCGADLDDGTAPPEPVRREAPDPPTVEPVPRRHARWLLPLFGAIVLALALVLALTLAGLGPFAPGPEVPPADFAADRYAGEPAPLVVTDVATRTTSSATGAEAATAIVDGDRSTAWRSDGTAVGDAEVLDTIDLVLDGPSWVAHLDVYNGDQLDADAYAESSRLREVRLVFDGGAVVLADLLDIGLRGQRVTLPEPVLTTVLRIEVLRAVEGANDQIAVSGLELSGWSATGDDVALAEERATAEPATGPVAPTVPAGLGRVADQSS